MILEWFWQVVDGFQGWILGLFGGWVLPDWFVGFSGLLGQILAGAAGMGVWIPWGFLGVVALATFTLWGAGLLIKVVRWLLGLIPTMGGG